MLESTGRTSVAGDARDYQVLVGGATRFFSWREAEKYFDFSPIMASCIVFQQCGLLHSGEDVVQGPNTPCELL
jgi:hypothetical protein